MIDTRKHGGTGSVKTTHLPLTDTLMDILERRRERLGTPPAPNGLVFGIPPEERDAALAERKLTTGTKGHMNGCVNYEPSRFRAKLKRCARLAGVAWWEKVRAHDLRHFVATNLLESGVAIQDVARVLRHRKTSTTLDMYAHSVDKNVLTALTKHDLGKG
jgi:integrase